MKKILLIPTLLATSIAPLSCLVSLTSCGKHDYSKDYITFKALEDGQLSCDISVQFGEPEINLDVQYSLNNGKWTTLELNKDRTYTNYLSYKTGDKIRLKGINDHWSRNDSVIYYSSLHFTGLVNASGNIMSLLYGDDFADKKTIPCDGCFESLFDPINFFSKNSSNLDFAQIKNAQNLILPATTLTESCYNSIFYDCINLINAPELPATTLADWCYCNMFNNCTRLVDAPELPATTLAYECYTSMFHNCDDLVTAPELPATTLADCCYWSMFNDCDSLKNAPKLPATTLVDCCYYEMFKNCTSLIVKTEGDDDHLIFNCPETQGLDRSVTDMFASTKGTHEDTPVPDTSYYWAEEE